MHWKGYSMLSNCQFNLNAKSVRENETERGEAGGEVDFIFFMPPASVVTHAVPYQHLFWAQLLAVSKAVESVSHDFPTYHQLNNLGHIIGVSQPCLLQGGK